MQTRLTVSGHPIQPMLVTFPLGLFVCATLLDLAHVSSGFAFLGEVGYWTAVAGLVSAALATAAGLVDLWDAPNDETRHTAVTFNLVNAAAAALFLAVCLSRAHLPHRAGSGWHLAVELLALAIGVGGVRLGTRLVRRFDEARGEPRSVSLVKPDRPSRERFRPVARHLGR